MRLTSDQDLQTATVAFRALADLRRNMDKSRKAVAAPVDDLKKEINRQAGDFIAEPEKEEARIEGLINHYQRQKLQQQRDAEAARDRELQAAQTQLTGAQTKENQAAALREKAKTAKPAEAARLIKQAEALESEALDMALNVESAALTVTGPVAGFKPKGLSVKVQFDYQVLKSYEFISSHPEFWTWNEKDETYKIKRRELLEEINKEGGMFAVNAPRGLNIFESVKSNVR